MSAAARGAAPERDLLSNTPEVSVSELSGALKRTLEDRFGQVRVRGEVSGYRGPHASGHVYFALKDAAAKIDAVIWKTAFARLRVKPQEGLEVVATGKITTFPGKSSYQIIIEALEPAGVGALMALLDERRRALAAEGLFDPVRKRPIPYLPRVIGVVTSPTGAVIRDIIHRLSERFPRHVLVWPVRVQGESSAQEVADAIAGFNALPIAGRMPRPDVIIVARGGGSLEDLWGFNEEIVVRAAAASAIPLIAAIGHETDWTLIDHVADLRAPTPTGAAEKAVPVRLDLVANLADLARRHVGAMSRASERRRGDLRALARALPAPDDLLAPARQRLDRAGERALAAQAALRDKLSLTLSRAARRLAAQSPQARMARAGERLAGARLRLRRARSVLLDQQARRLEAQGARLAINLAQAGARHAALRERIARAAMAVARRMLDAQARRAALLLALAQRGRALSYAAVLERGFALVRDGSGHALRRSADIAAGAPLELQFADGRILARAEADGGGVKGPRPLSRRKAANPGQGTLL